MSEAKKYRVTLWRTVREEYEDEVVAHSQEDAVALAQELADSSLGAWQFVSTVDGGASAREMRP